MNLWQYLDLRNRRKYLKNEIISLRKQIDGNSLYVWPEIREDKSTWGTYFEEKDQLQGKLSYYENKLKELL